MEFTKTFAILHQIIQEYSAQPISASSLLSYLTIQIINDCLISLDELPVSKSEKAILKKIGQASFRNTQKTKQQILMSQIATQSSLNRKQIASQPNDEEIKQAYLGQNSFCFTIFLVHQYRKATKNKLFSRLFQNVQNIIAIDQFLQFSNNILHHEPKNVLGKTIIIISINQTKRRKGINTSNAKFVEKKNQFLFVEMERFMQLWEVLYAHVGPRICMYNEQDSQSLSGMTFSEKIRLFTQVISDSKDPEDDLDVLLRPQIPDSAFIKILKQRGYKNSKEQVKISSQYTIISQKQSHLTYCLSNNSILTAKDQLVIWVIKKNEPYFGLLPQIEKSKFKNRLKRNKKDKFEEFRSLLGYTKLSMEQKIYIQKKKRQQQKLQQDELDSCICFDSQNISISNCSIEEINNDKQMNPCICIINILDETLNNKEEQALIESQMLEVVEIFLKSRKQVQDNLELNNNLQMIKRVSEILGVPDKDIFHAIYISKL